jgi:hypothetical protein
MKSKATWYRHSRHGYMLRGPIDSDGWQIVVTALCTDMRETEESRELWEAHKSRLRVNGGCGAIAVDGIRANDHNPEFRRIRPASVPAHIVSDFTQYLEGA